MVGEASFCEMSKMFNVDKESKTQSRFQGLCVKRMLRYCGGAELNATWRQLLAMSVEAQHATTLFKEDSCEDELTEWNALDENCCNHDIKGSS